MNHTERAQAQGQMFPVDFPSPAEQQALEL